MLRCVFLGLLLVFAATIQPLRVHAQFGNLTKRIPDRANTLVLVNVDKAHASPVAKKEGWRDAHEKQFAAGLTILPPQASLFLMAAKMDFEYMQPTWDMAAMDLKYEPSIPKLAVQTGATPDNIGGLEAAMLPEDVCVVKFGPRFAGLMRPANRQNVAAWINRVHSNQTPPLSPYLAEAVTYAEGGSPVIMAMDLSNVVAPARVRQRLNSIECLKGKDVDLDQLAQTLASIKGIMLGITLGDNRYAKIKVDFGKDVSIMDGFAKELLLEVLANQGAMIDEFASWQEQVTGTQVSLGGVLYQSGMRRIMSIMETPPSFQTHQQTPADDQETEDKMVAVASQQYFKNVVSLLDDLRGKRQSENFTTWGQIGMWFEKYARKIDRLPLLNVDPQMLDYGAFVADSLRQAENAMKGIGAKSGYRKTQLPNYYNVQQTGYQPIGVTRRGVAGVYSYRVDEDLASRGQAESQVRTQEKIKGNMTANMIVQGIEAATADIRRVMTQKYQMEF